MIYDMVDIQYNMVDIQYLQSLVMTIYVCEEIDLTLFVFFRYLHRVVDFWTTILNYIIID